MFTVLVDLTDSEKRLRLIRRVEGVVAEDVVKSSLSLEVFPGSTFSWSSAIVIKESSVSSTYVQLRVARRVLLAGTSSVAAGRSALAASDCQEGYHEWRLPSSPVLLVLLPRVVAAMIRRIVMAVDYMTGSYERCNHNKRKNNCLNVVYNSRDQASSIRQLVRLP